MPWHPIEIRHTQTEQAEQRAYDRIYIERGLHQRDSLYLWFLDQVRRFAPPPARLLDISCGEGGFLRFAHRAGYSVTGFDFSLAALRRLDQHGGASLPVVMANAQILPFAGASFDVITNIGSLEHYFDPGQAIAEMARVLRPEGVAIILVPNAYGIFGNVLHVLRHGEVFDDGQPLQRYATRRSWERLLAEHGLMARRVLVLERPFPRTARDFWWMARRPHTFVRAVFGGLVPANLGDQLIFVCTVAHPDLNP